MNGNNCQRCEDDDQNAHAGYGAIGRTDEAGHISTDRCNQKACKKRENHRNSNEHCCVVCDFRPVCKEPEQAAHRDHRQDDDQCDDRDRDVAFSLRNFAAIVTGVRGTHCVADSLDDGGNDLDQSPDRSNGHDACTDVTHLAGENCTHDV